MRIDRYIHVWFLPSWIGVSPIFKQLKKYHPIRMIVKKFGQFGQTDSRTDVPRLTILIMNWRTCIFKQFAFMIIVANAFQQLSTSDKCTAICLNFFGSDRLNTQWLPQNCLTFFCFFYTSCSFKKMISL